MLTWSLGGGSPVDQLKRQAAFRHKSPEERETFICGRPPSAICLPRLFAFSFLKPLTDVLEPQLALRSSIRIIDYFGADRNAVQRLKPARFY